MATMEKFKLNLLLAGHIRKERSSTFPAPMKAVDIYF
jgi:hypothetical protein